MKPLVILGHLGLGDMLILNGLVRQLARSRADVRLPCKMDNLPSVCWLYGDLPQVHIVGVKDDTAANDLVFVWERDKFDVLRLGLHNKKEPLDPARWDEQMYEQAGVSFSERWDGFLAPEVIQPVEPPDKPFFFVHQDMKRGFCIDSQRLPAVPMPHAEAHGRRNIFAYRRLLEEAESIHCIDSCFAILADSIPTKDYRPTLHLYARAGARPPKYRKKWRILE